ncbi:hypothetical protein NQ317_008705 [Molorchus minor]|uniref:Small RNA 2'-O-methyltransferase n=1 Tax=Molorchus minor TaxID=1323400 RepID=A0ABQ9J363_9CUCU|nr:hypothetical protein NQ317_008705 [Molorchus minor]
MIIIFHYLSILIFQFLRNRKRIQFLQEIEDSITQENNSPKHEDLEYNLKFDPPVFRQRYGKVYEILLDEKWRKQVKTVVDFGCAEFGLFVFIKRLTSLNHIICVDIDEDTIKQHSWKVRPLTIEYLKRREQPLEISIYAGSIANPDYRLLKIDAVIAVEIVEHLYPDALEAFPYNIFGFIEPKLVIVTTPNADFNVLFSSDPKRFRHYDHKFEWSREQFEDWRWSRRTEHLGQCSQMAVFIKKDLLDPDHVSKMYCFPCSCGENSPCKGYDHRIQAHVQFYSKQVIQYEIEDEGEQFPSYNMYYKFIEKIEYPVECDGRGEDDKMMDDLKYRINTYGREWGRFYVEDRCRSEIPLGELLYGPNGCSITISELHKLLTTFGYRIEECTVQETGLVEDCLIYYPLPKEESSSSEASGYDSDVADVAKYNIGEESFSDWDEPFAKESCKPSESYQSSKDMTSRDSHLEAAADVDEEKKQDPLVDSGYQKSLSLVDDSPQTPQEDLEETDLFEETTSTPSLTSEDNKVHLKKVSVFEKASHSPSTDASRLKIDSNRVNELDRYRNMPSGRTFLNHPLPPPPPEIFRKSFLRERDALPGPSNAASRKRKKVKRGASTDVDDDSPLADVKSIATCILENTLNKINIVDRDELIEYAGPVVEVVAGAADDEERWELEELPDVQIADDLEPVPVVENGDLANNNRDVEGNNYIAQDEGDDNIGNDIVNDNLGIPEDLPQILEDNANIDNNNENVDVLQAIQDPLIVVNVEEAEGLQAAGNPEEILQDESVISKASREVLFDPDSEQDLLGEFDMPPAIHETEVHSLPNLWHNNDPNNHNLLLTGIRLGSTQDTLETDQDGFPNWLLQMLGAQGMLEEVTPPGSEEGSHFYCQGDGLGVHPSVVAVDVEDEEESSDTSTTNNTADYGEAEQNSSQDMSSLPEDSQINAQENPG